ncbi:uncharacterized protein LOC118648743 isoform X3 [Monomorium pharaonis]|nr:uncharacterized protein LOC118648743 isoform X3 [Monomorium pharaonis]XP_036151037.1 uncharacterized protein LOC118648743 isoform X3 [Monomorium pharaonis]XP_036151038.1 uncharacterized protein LOC118648743 isoform X3 [Monomorium pharaonis]XP_036151039.1 uncharacterized protein LOC118648743 isoform X3 [Monomorium pharaonis]XP_036151040.1 uncharacterized protein LOC118648743 isoform X3 [Monomorium pharaonis]XP_036151041.1 uncharacterized protein LOC118648743 isoform X3 [Monomorium pharaonis]
MLSSRQQNDIKTLSTACNNFMISLYKNLSTNIDNIGNIVISPLSLHMTLSLLSNGAGDHTLNEIKSVLHHDDIISLNNGFNILALLLNDVQINTRCTIETDNMCHVLAHLRSLGYRVKKDTNTDGKRKRKARFYKIDRKQRKQSDRCEWIRGHGK